MSWTLLDTSVLLYLLLLFLGEGSVSGITFLGSLTCEMVAHVLFASWLCRTWERIRIQMSCRRREGTYPFLVAVFQIFLSIVDSMVNWCAIVKMIPERLIYVSMFFEVYLNFIMPVYRGIFYTIVKRTITDLAG